MSDQAFKPIVDYLNIGVVIHDQQTRIEYINDKALELLQLSRGQAEGTDALDDQWQFVDAYETTLAYADFPVNQVLDTGEPLLNFVMGAQKGPDITWFLVNAYLQPATINTEKKVVVNFTDYTPLKNETSFRQVVESTDDVIVITKASQIDEPGPEIVYVNRAFEKLTEYKAAEVLGKSPRILQGEGTDSKTRDRIRSALKRKKSHRDIILNYSKSGNPYWLELNIIPLVDDTGRVNYFAAIERDVTESQQHRKFLERSIEESQTIRRQLERVIEDQQGKINLFDEKVKVSEELQDLADAPSNRIMAWVSFSVLALSFILTCVLTYTNHQINKNKVLENLALEAGYYRSLLQHQTQSIEGKLLKAGALYNDALNTDNLTELQQMLYTAFMQSDGIEVMGFAGEDKVIDQVMFVSGPSSIPVKASGFRKMMQQGVNELNGFHSSISSTQLDNLPNRVLLVLPLDDSHISQGYVTAVANYSEWMSALHTNIDDEHSIFKLLNPHQKTANFENHDHAGSVHFLDDIKLYDESFLLHGYKTELGVKKLYLLSSFTVFITGFIISLIIYYAIRANYRRRVQEAIDHSTHKLVIRQLAKESDLSAQLLKAKSKAQAVIDSILEVVIVIDKDGEVVSANKATYAMLGYYHHEITGKNITMLMDHDDASHHDGYLKHYQQTGESSIIGTGRVIRVKKKDGSFISAHLSVTDISTEEKIEYVGIITDISEQVEKERSARYLALHDTLTSLPNKMAVMDRLAVAISKVGRSNHAMAVLFIDLDGFKPVNDNYGHDYGDDLLIAFSYRLKQQIRHSDTAARIGGDEFLVVLEELSDYEQSRIIAQKIITALKQPFEVKGQSISIGCSIGIAFPYHENEPAVELVKRADIAMYKAKSGGKNQYYLDQGSI